MSIRNFKLKHIALGLVLAGVSSSSAWAIEATTSDIVKGHKPFVVSTHSSKQVTGDDLKADPTAAKLGLQVEFTNLADVQDTSTNPPTMKKKLTPASKVTLSYNFLDYDGDDDSITAGDDTSARSIELYYKNSSNVWIKFADALAGTALTKTGEKTDIQFSIPTSVVGTKAIGLIMKVKSKYGEPDGSDTGWIVVENIFSDQPDQPVVLAGTKPADPSAGGKLNTQITGPVPDPTDPTDVDPTSQSQWAAIIEGQRPGTYVAPTSATDFVNQGIPKVGNTYHVVAWADSTGTTKNYTNATEANSITDNKTWTWYLSSTGRSVTQKPSWSDDLSADVKVGTGVSFTIKKNEDTRTDATTAGVVATEVAKLKAGAQGYKLSVKSN